MDELSVRCPKRSGDGIYGNSLDGVQTVDSVYEQSRGVYMNIQDSVWGI